MSSEPYVATVNSTQRRAASSSVACAPKPTAVPVTWAAASSAASCLREVSTTRAPAAASACAVASPMPREAPVTRAVRPARSGPVICGSALRAVFAELDAGDAALVHLVGAVGQAQRAQMRPGPGEEEVVGNAGRPVHLDGTVEDLQSHGGCGDLDGGDLGPGLLV